MFNNVKKRLSLLWNTGRVPVEGAGDNKHGKFETQFAVLKGLVCCVRVFVILMFLVVVMSLITALVHEKSKKILNVKQQEKYLNGLYLPAMFDRGKHYYSQHDFGFKLRRYATTKSREDSDRALAYFESQLPMFKQAIKNFSLHRHFANLPLPKSESITFHDLIKTRGEMLASNLEKHGWEDFRIEKDKCSMFEFLKNNGLPHVAWYTILRSDQPQYSSPDLVLAEIRNVIDSNINAHVIDSNINAHKIDSKINDITNTTLIHHSGSVKGGLFPMFIKSCHLTTGASKSVRRIMNQTHLTQGWGSVVSWLHRMWEYKSYDWERVWFSSFDQLTSTLTPGFMLQGPWQSGQTNYPTEIKVEVLWGRAYLAFVSTGECGGDSIILRDNTVWRYTDSLMQNILHMGEPDSCYAWIAQEGHLPRVWFMAESAAKLMGTDAMRVDVFVQKGKPHSSVINENSLSSGAEYRWHFEYMAKIWAMGHQDKSYNVVDPGVDVHKWWRGEHYYSSKMALCNPELSFDHSLKNSRECAA